MQRLKGKHQYLDTGTIKKKKKDKVHGIISYLIVVSYRTENEEIVAASSPIKRKK